MRLFCEETVMATRGSGPQCLSARPTHRRGTRGETYDDYQDPSYNILFNERSIRDGLGGLGRWRVRGRSHRTPSPLACVGPARMPDK